MANNVIITKKSRENMVKARAGAIPLSKIVGMAFGDGGVDLSGNVVAPTKDQIELKNELFRKEIENYRFPDDTTCQYVCVLTENELAGSDISEIGLYDENGDLACIKTFKSKGKDDDIRMTFTLDDVF